jgi:hypothetical protein
MNDMKPAAKRKASRRAPAKRAKSARRPSTRTAKAAARRASPKNAKTASRAPAKRAKPVPAKPAQAATQPKRLPSRLKTLIPIITPLEITVSAHKFRVGEAVHLTAGIFARGGASNVYKVTQLLPSDGDEQQYRIKSASEPHERVAKQSQLEPAA